MLGVNDFDIRLAADRLLMRRNAARALNDAIDRGVSPPRPQLLSVVNFFRAKNMLDESIPEKDIPAWIANHYTYKANLGKCFLVTAEGMLELLNLIEFSAKKVA